MILYQYYTVKTRISDYTESIRRIKIYLHFFYSPPKTIMISGFPAKGNADFPPEAVQHFHEKPIPTHDARPAHSSRPIIIQQPRK